MKYFIYISIILFFSSKLNSEDRRWDARADLAYTHGGNREALIETLRLGVRYKVYEHPHKKYMVYIGGNAITERDFFEKIIKVNGFLTLGLEY
jgi:hypothetical protein